MSEQQTHPSRSLSDSPRQFHRLLTALRPRVEREMKMCSRICGKWIVRSPCNSLVPITNMQQSESCNAQAAWGWSAHQLHLCLMSARGKSFISFFMHERLCAPSLNICVHPCVPMDMSCSCFPCVSCACMWNIEEKKKKGPFISANTPLGSRRYLNLLRHNARA